MFYPVIQAISRSGYAWYELQYGATIDVDNPSPDQFASLIFLTIVTPFVSIGYMVIFIVMQPDAYQHFLAMFGCGSYGRPNENALANHNSTEIQNPVRTNRNRQTIETLSYYTDGVEGDEEGTRDSYVSGVGEYDANRGEKGIQMSMSDWVRDSEMTEGRPTNHRSSALAKPSYNHRSSAQMRQSAKIAATSALMNATSDEDLIDFIDQTTKLTESSSNTNIHSMKFTPPSRQSTMLSPVSEEELTVTQSQPSLRGSSSIFRSSSDFTGSSSNLANVGSIRLSTTSTSNAQQMRNEVLNVLHEHGQNGDEDEEGSRTS